MYNIDRVIMNANVTHACNRDTRCTINCLSIRTAAVRECSLIIIYYFCYYNNYSYYSLLLIIIIALISLSLNLETMFNKNIILLYVST